MYVYLYRSDVDKNVLSLTQKEQRQLNVFVVRLHYPHVMKVVKLIQISVLIFIKMRLFDNPSVYIYI